MSRNIIRSI